MTLRATPCDCTRCDDDEEQLRFHEAEDAEHAMMLYLIVCFDALQVEADIIVVLLVYYATFFFNVERFPIQWLRLQLAIIEIERLANDLESATPTTSRVTSAQNNMTLKPLTQATLVESWSLLELQCLNSMNQTPTVIKGESLSSLNANHTQYS